MKKITAGVFFFVILSSFSGFFIGMLLSPFFIPEDTGMFGGMLVLSYGVLAMPIGFLLGVISWRFLKPSQLKIFNRLMGVFCLGFVLWLGYRIIITQIPS